MKKLDIKIMDTINGGGKNRDCMLVGVFTGLAAIATGGLSLFAVTTLAGTAGAAGTGCFS